MSWALSATPANGAIDATPLAATLKAQDASSNKFFPTTTQTIPQLTPQEQEEQEWFQLHPEQQYTNRSTVSSVYTLNSVPPSQQASARNKPSAFVLTSMTTNTGGNKSRQNGGGNGQGGDKKDVVLTSDAGPQLLPLHAQEALKSEVAHLKRELMRSEAKLIEREQAFSKVSEEKHKLEQDKIVEHARLRSTIKELKKSIAEHESRLAFFRADAHSRKESEMAQVQKDNANILEQQNALIESIGSTIAKSASSIISSELIANNPNFSGASVGMTHEEYLKAVLERFKKERLEWDRSKAVEINSIKQQHSLELAAQQEKTKKIKSQYLNQYATWKKQHGSLISELDYLSEYIVKLTYLLGEIDRGAYPVSSKHGITSYHIPSTKRAFLAYEPKEHQRLSGMMDEKLAKLKAAYERARIPWNPELLHTNQSFLEDEKQREIRALKLGDSQQLKLTAGTQAPQATIDTQQLRLKAALENSGEEEGDAGSGPEEESKEEASSQSRSQQQQQLTEADYTDTFHRELSSHPTVQYITRLEEELSHYKYLFSKETKKKLELHQTLVSQNRLIEGNELFKKSKMETEQRRQSVSNSLMNSSQSSMTQLLQSAAQQQQTSGTSTGAGPSQVPVSKLNHSPSSSQSKARDILQASSTVAYNPNAGKVGINIGFHTSQAGATTLVADGGVGLTQGQPFLMNASGSMGILTSPSRQIQHQETQHTGGSYHNANLRPSSATTRAVYDSRPISAISAATTSYIGRGSTATSRPTSAIVMSNRPVSSHNHPTPAYPIVHPAQFAKPIPMHIAHGNASTMLYSHQLARKSHQEANELHSGIHLSPASSNTPLDTTHTQSSTQRSRPPSASPTTSARPQKHRAASAGPRR